VCGTAEQAEGLTVILQGRIRHPMRIVHSPCAITQDGLSFGLGLRRIALSLQLTLPDYCLFAGCSGQDGWNER
jgi:hypothetical protein